MKFDPEATLKEPFEMLFQKALQEIGIDDYSSEEDFVKMLKLTLKIFIERIIEEKRNSLVEKRELLKDDDINSAIMRVEKILYSFLDVKINEIKNEHLFYELKRQSKIYDNA